ncbi:hypothetical protein BVRB_007830 [Beta vulgaris subsp. vulgaris]|uniref:Uncharacterized protein n=1 Tax=Beta vulgaris subsp. vulgaris TaxID=3555 RepID=A0A0J8B6F1_BETVV|nr:hypothetical protein BVRB_007830 [Beta vulgaris subsp. vulgaris]
MSSHTAEPVCLNSDEELDSACVKNEIKDKKKGALDVNCELCVLVVICEL